ncbi:MAG: hypothetical protein GXP63_06950 [DPANN group archaeon]|nr:hypothetical protein [DPANN group archaeon]
MASFVRNKDFLSLILGQLLYYISHWFSWAIFPVYLLANGYSFIDLVLFYLVAFFTTIVVQTFFHTRGMKRIITRGLFLRLIMVLLLVHLFFRWQLWLLAIIYGTFWSFFWVVYNIRYFELTTEGGTAFASAILASIGPIVSVLVPLLTGLLSGVIGFQTSFLLSIPFLFASWYAFKKLPAKNAEYNIVRALASMQNLKRLLFIDGFWQASYYVLIPIITLSYVHSPLGFGAFLSYLGIIGVLASFVLSRLADRYRNRSIFIYPATIFMAAFTIAAAFTDSFWGWLIVVGLFSFFRGIASPLMMTVVIDSKKDLHDAMLGRTYLLMVGRFFGTLSVLVSFSLLGSFRYSLILVGLVAAGYPFILFTTRVYDTVDRRMRYAANHRFRVMVRLFVASPLMFFPRRIRKRWPSVTQFWSDLKINRMLRR